MNTQTRKQIMQAAYATKKIANGYATAAIAVLLALQAGGCASVESSRNPSNVPAKLTPSADESLTGVVAATGVQIYECRASHDRPGAYEWAFVAPEASLFDEHGNRIGRHYGGPHWESNDGSKVVGAVKERVDAPVANAIPWLLLSARSVGPQGSFSKVTSIQRVNTVGGAAPPDGCSQAVAGATTRIGYTANYYFFSVNQTGRRANNHVAPARY